MSINEIPDKLFIELDETETKSFQKWARDNYKLGDDISPLWHPVVRKECAAMNKEEERKNIPECPDCGSIEFDRVMEVDATDRVVYMMGEPHVEQMSFEVHASYIRCANPDCMLDDLEDREDGKQFTDLFYKAGE